MKNFTKKFGILAAAIAFVGIGSIAQADDLLYDWNATTPATTPISGYTPAPFVTDANAASVVTQLTQQQAATPGKVAIKLLTPLSPANTALLFNNPNFTVNYTFMDFETARPAGGSGNADIIAAQAQANLIHAQTKGAGTYVGNFRLFPGNGDTSGPGAGPSFADYTSGGPLGVNMANEDLYPGSPFYKSPSQVGGSSSSPNIRSSLFVLPIERASFVTSNLPAGHQHIPYVNRFNNAGNAALDTDGNPANGYRFTNPTGNQMLSRSDFSALVAHYRLRGVNGVHLLDGGVEGYTQAQFEQDAKDGFTFAPIANIFNGGGAKLATLDTTSKVDGVVQDNETTGVVFSGVYSLTQGTGKLALLVSNMSDSAHTLSIPNTIGGKTVADPIGVLAGQHKLLEFTGAGLQWSLANTSIVFDTNTDRSGVGVPEPVAMGGASIFALTMLFRRRRAR